MRRGGASRLFGGLSVVGVIDRRIEILLAIHHHPLHGTCAILGLDHVVKDGFLGLLAAGLWRGLRLLIGGRSTAADRGALRRVRPAII